MKQEIVIKKLKDWAQDDPLVKAMILTGSRVDPKSKPDVFSDYDIELYVVDLKTFLSDNWLEFWGPIMVRWTLKPTINRDYITRLILFEDCIRIDFQITSRTSIESSLYDCGYKVLVDKIGITQNLEEPTYSKYIIKKPTQEEFTALVNDFFWDITYIPKCLQRDEIYFAKFQLDNVIRFEYLEKMIEWYIGSEYNWKISTKIHGRDFKKYLNPDKWLELECTFSSANIEDNWKALFNMIKFFRKLAKSLALELNYEYPANIDTKVTKYCHKAKP